MRTLRRNVTPLVLALLPAVVTPLPAQTPEKASGGDLSGAEVGTPDAAQLYERAWQELIRGLGTDDYDTSFLPIAMGYVRDWDLRRVAWGERLTRSLAARRTFAQAAAMSECILPGVKGGEYPNSDPSCFQMFHLGLLVAGAAYDELQSEPRRALDGAVTLLRCAQHLIAQGRRDELSFGFALEATAMNLLAAVLEDARRAPERAALIEHASKELELHVAARLSMPRVADLVIEEARWSLPRPRAVRDDDEPEVAAELRELQAMVGRAIAIVTDHVALLRSDQLPDVAELRDAWRKLETRYEVVAAELKRIERAGKDDRTAAARLEDDALLHVVSLDFRLDWIVEHELWLRTKIDRIRARLLELAKGR